MSRYLVAPQASPAPPPQKKKNQIKNGQDCFPQSQRSETARTPKLPNLNFQDTALSHGSSASSPPIILARTKISATRRELKLLRTTATLLHLLKGRSRAHEVFFAFAHNFDSCREGPLRATKGKAPLRKASPLPFHSLFLSRESISYKKSPPLPPPILPHCRQEFGGGGGGMTFCKARCASR